MSGIQYLHNHELNADKWDACIRDAEPGLLYAYSWYLDIVCDEWDALVLNDYEAVMPLPFTKKFGFHLAIQPPFAQQLGIFSTATMNPELIRSFINAIPKKFKWVKYQLNYRNHSDVQSTRTNFVLDLIQPYEQLRAAYDKSLIRHLKKSEKSSCSLIEGVDFPSLMELVDYQNKAKNMGISLKSREKLKQILNSATAKGAVFVVGFYSPMNHLCSAGIFLKDRDRIYYLQGASDDVGREHYGMGRILDYVIHKYSGQAYTLDFEGSEIPGIAHFFQHFAPQNSPYPVLIRKNFGFLNPLVERKLGG